MVFKKVLCVFLAVLSLVSFCSCGKNDENEDKNTQKPSNTTETGEINLLYCKLDSFNPYTAVSEINRNLSKLLFEPLVKTDNEFEPSFRLAKTAELGDKVCTVELKAASFSDGSYVTANDVIYSYNLAKASATNYSHKLYEVTKVEAINDKTIVFHLTKNDPYFLNLIDFPIIKADSDKIVNSDGVTASPIGCGRYIPSDDGTYFTANDSFYGKKPNIKKILLTNAPDEASVSHYVEVGATDIYYTDLSDGEIVRMSGKKADVNLNNLVYIGINSAYPELSNKYIRYAISSAINRSEICSNAYYNNAVAATGFFNPVFANVNATQSLNSKPNLQITVENLEKIGYNKVANDGSRVNSKGKRPKFTLLVNSENASRVQAANLIKKQLEQAGIEITVVSKSYEQYIEALTNAQFQLYLGEVNLLPNMDLSALVLEGGSAAFGIIPETAPLNPDGTLGETPQSNTQIAIDNFYNGAALLSDVAATLLTEMPQIPVCYRRGLLFYNSSISGDVEVSQSDIYFSFEEYINK